MEATDPEHYQPATIALHLSVPDGRHDVIRARAGEELVHLLYKSTSSFYNCEGRFDLTSAIEQSQSSAMAYNGDILRC